MTNRALLVAAVTALALPGCSSVGGGVGGWSDGSDSDDFERRYYAGAGTLISQLEPDTGNDDSLELDDDQGIGGSLVAGLDINSRLAVEAHIADLGEAGLSPQGEIAYQVGGLSGLVYALNHENDRRLREGFSIFGRLGVGTLRNEADDVVFERVNDVHLLAGIGGEYGLMNGFALRGEFVAHETDAKYVQLALLYRFRKARSNHRSGSPAASDAATGKSADSSTEDTLVTAVPTPPRWAEGTSLDADDDGVIDASDRCEDTRSGAPVDEHGCDAFGGVVEGVSFESGVDRLTVGSRGVLEGIAATLRAYPAIGISIEAHTDNRGSAQSNLDLSRRRALAVARYLASQGVEPRRIKPKAYGESQPRSDNSTPAGRSANRRVEISLRE